MAIRVKDWDRFQHFKDRRPPWIKLYRDILDDMEWHDLDAEAAKALVMMWLIASENEGHLPDDKKLAFRLRISTEKCNLLISKLSHWLGQDDNSAISERYQDDRLERETETETEGDRPATKRSPKPKGVTLREWLADLAGEDAIPAADPIFDWAETQGLPAGWLAMAWFAFENRYLDDPKTYADWRAVFRRALRDDWLRLWRNGRSGWELTTAGVQAEREMANG